MRGERMSADGPTNEVGGGVGGPGDGKSEEQEAGSVGAQAVKPDGEGERESHEQERARRDTRGGKRLDQGPTGENGEYRKAQEEHQQEHRNPAVSINDVKLEDGIARYPGVPQRKTKLKKKQQQGREDRPEAVSAVADSVSEGEVFAESEDGNKGDGEGHNRGGGEKDDGENDGDEDERGQDASAGHGVGE